MKRYRAGFYGRSRGALGVIHWCRTIVEGEDEEQALLNLYDAFEHISHAQFEEITEDEPPRTA